ncbi:MAG TPA: hypothetical protein VHC20_00860, partial [Candidatus Paceibacterota bacterium]|nr:hypothetical protein [Candidatus Paceibacterota bacterium]
MRSFLDWAKSECVPIETEYVSTREAPYGYLVGLKRAIGHNVLVPGHYEAPTGGCDTIHDIAMLYKFIENTVRQGCHVVYEGLFVMNMTRGPALLEELGVPFYVLQLTTPLSVCLESVNKRRAEKGKGELETTKNTEDNYRRALKYCSVMRDAGAKVIKIEREQGLPKLLELLGVE